MVILLLLVISMSAKMEMKMMIIIMVLGLYGLKMGICVFILDILLQIFRYLNFGPL